MVAFIEKSPVLARSHEKATALAGRVRKVLAANALFAIEVYGETLGPAQGRHVLHDRNYHHSAMRYVDEARQAKEHPRKGSDTIEMRFAKRQTPASTAELKRSIRADEDRKFLFTQPDQQIPRFPLNKR